MRRRNGRGRGLALFVGVALAVAVGFADAARADDQPPSGAVTTDPIGQLRAAAAAGDPAQITAAALAVEQQRAQAAPPPSTPSTPSRGNSTLRPADPAVVQPPEPQQAPVATQDPAPAPNPVGVTAAVPPASEPAQTSGETPTQTTTAEPTPPSPVSPPQQRAAPSEGVTPPTTEAPAGGQEGGGQEGNQSITLVVPQTPATPAPSDGGGGDEPGDPISVPSPGTTAAGYASAVTTVVRHRGVQSLARHATPREAPAMPRTTSRDVAATPSHFRVGQVETFGSGLPAVTHTRATVTHGGAARRHLPAPLPRTPGHPFGLAPVFFGSGGGSTLVTFAILVALLMLAIPRFARRFAIRAAVWRERAFPAPLPRPG